MGLYWEDGRFVLDWILGRGTSDSHVVRESIRSPESMDQYRPIAVLVETEDLEFVNKVVSE